MTSFRILLFLWCCGLATAAERMPLSSSTWRDPAFVKSFLGAYQPNNRIEPFISDEERTALQRLEPLLKAGNRKGAISSLQKERLSKSSAALSFNLGQLLFEEGQLKDAVRAYETALTQYPDFRRAHTSLGITHARLEKLDEALPHLTKAVSLGDQSGTTYGLLGYCWLGKGKFASALQAYRNAQMTMPDVLDWKLGEAQCLQATKDHGAAARLFQEALHERPTDGQLWLHFGSAQLGLEHESEAAAAFEYAQRLGGLEASALKTLGDLYLRLRLPGLALNRYQEAMEMKNGLKAEDALAAASALVSQQHWTQARGFLASVRERHKMLPKTPEHRIARRLDAMLLMKEGDQKQAITMLEEILSEDPMDGEVLLLLGDYHWQAKDYEEAEMCFERAQRVGRTEVRACLARGRLQVGLLEYAPAIKNLVRAQNLSPSAALAEYLQEVRGAAAAAGL